MRAKEFEMNFWFEYFCFRIDKAKPEIQHQMPHLKPVRQDLAKS
jgi:hypothetical protein